MELGQGSFEVSFVPEISATYGLAVGFDGSRMLTGSPFQIRARNDETIAGNCKLFGAGLAQGTAGEKTSFTIQAVSLPERWAVHTQNTPSRNLLFSLLQSSPLQYSSNVFSCLHDAGVGTWDLPQFETTSTTSNPCSFSKGTPPCGACGGFIQTQVCNVLCGMRASASIDSNAVRWKLILAIK